jgi:hypothetical protein
MVKPKCYAITKPVVKQCPAGGVEWVQNRGAYFSYHPCPCDKCVQDRKERRQQA